MTVPLPLYEATLAGSSNGNVCTTTTQTHSHTHSRSDKQILCVPVQGPPRLDFAFSLKPPTPHSLYPLPFVCPVVNVTQTAAALKHIKPTKISLVVH